MISLRALIFAALAFVIYMLISSFGDGGFFRHRGTRMGLLASEG